MNDHPRRRASDHSFARRTRAACRENPIVTLLVLALVGIIAIAAILQFVLAPRAAHNEAKLVTLEHQNRDLATSTARASLAQCQRNNVARAETIRLYEAIHDGNRGRARNAKFFLGLAEQQGPSNPAITYLRADYKAAHDEARKVIHVAQALADAQHAVARYPSAKDPAKRSIVACDKQFGKRTR